MHEYVSFEVHNLMPGVMWLYHPCVFYYFLCLLIFSVSGTLKIMWQFPHVRACDRTCVLTVSHTCVNHNSHIIIPAKPKRYRATSINVNALAWFSSDWIPQQMQTALCHYALFGYWCESTCLLLMHPFLLMYPFHTMVSDVHTPPLHLILCVPYVVCHICYTAFLLPNLLVKPLLCIYYIRIIHLHTHIYAHMSSRIYILLAELVHRKTCVSSILLLRQRSSPVIPATLQVWHESVPSCLP